MTTSMVYNEETIYFYKKVIDDLLATVENTISGISSVSRRNVNNFIEYRIQTAENHPIVILLYENGTEEEIKNAYADTKMEKLEQEDETDSISSKTFAPPQCAHGNDILEENPECIFKKEISISFERNNCNSLKDGIEANENPEKLMGNSNDITNHTENEQIQRSQQNCFNNESEKIDEFDTVNLHSSQLIPKNEEDNCDKLSSLHITSMNSALVDNTGVISNKNNTLSIRTVSSDSTVIPTTTSATITTYVYKSKQKCKPKDSNKKAHGCDYCEKTFSSNSKKKSHERMHTGEKPYSCSYCDKKFSYLGNKQLHERTHTGEKPFECIYCKKPFANLSHKTVHERYHTGERPYKCKFCEKYFISSGDKVNHERIHTEEKPYSCDFCEKRFAWRTSKIKHEKNHSSEKSYKCDLCEKVFTQLGDQQNHECIHT